MLKCILMCALLKNIVLYTVLYMVLFPVRRMAGCDGQAGARRVEAATIRPVSSVLKTSQVCK